MVIEINLREEKAKAELLIQDLRVANEVSSFFFVHNDYALQNHQNLLYNNNQNLF